jgi:hypothetical protein
VAEPVTSVQDAEASNFGQIVGAENAQRGSFGIAKLLIDLINFRLTKEWVKVKQALVLVQRETICHSRKKIADLPGVAALVRNGRIFPPVLSAAVSHRSCRR